MRFSFAPVQEFIRSMLGLRATPSFESCTPNPSRDWKLLLACMTLLLLAGILFSAYVFIRVRSNATVQTVPTGAASITVEDVRAAEAVAKDREGRYELLTKSAPPVVDPSR